MISLANNHQKHADLARPFLGEWGRNELAILGTDCGTIKQLAHAIIKSLPQYKMAYVDADHKSGDADQQSVSAINNGAYIEYTNKISFTRFDINTQPNTFQKRTFFNECDLILVNGNHFSASKQIIVIDEKKPLEKKLEKLTDVQAILLKDSTANIPGYIINHLPHFSSVPQFNLNNTNAIVQYIKQWKQQQVPVINGLVLAGGQSTRMGRDKGNLKYYQTTQRQHVYNLLQSFCNEVFISCNEDQIKRDNALPFIQDRFLQLGPMGGILSAFQKSPNTAWLTLACDLPFLDSPTIQYLVEHRNSAKTATAFWDAEDRFPEPLVTIWEPRAYSVLLQFLAQGYSCPRKALINSDVEILKAPDASAFKNVNTTEEYKEAVQNIQNKHNYC